VGGLVWHKDQHPTQPTNPNPQTNLADDLAAIVFTVHGCLATQLREFEFATHFISNAECTAIGQMTGLTSLRCSSPHGFSPGGLAALHRLTNLRRLEITDAPRSGREEDIRALAGLTGLTRLALGGSATLLRPLLRRIAVVNGCCTLEQTAADAAAASEGVVQELVAIGGQYMLHHAMVQQLQQEVRRVVAAASAAVQGGGGAAQVAGHHKLQLVELEGTMDLVQSANLELLSSIAWLTSLTSLTVSDEGVLVFAL